MTLKLRSKRKSKKIGRIIKKKEKSAKKRMKKLKKTTHHKKLSKDPGIPNLFPYKKKLLQKILQKSNELENQKQNSIINKAQNRSDENFSPSENNLKNLKSENSRLVPKNQKYSNILHKVIEISDIILFVLDARDPNGCRNRKLENLIQSQMSDNLGTQKKLILIINKIDLVPAMITNKWLNYLKREFPVIVFKASTQTQQTRLGVSKTTQKDINDRELNRTNLCVGAETLLSLIKSYSRSCYLPHKSNSKSLPKNIKVGVIGYPNTGKSSLINSLKRKKIAAVSPVPGHTKDIQEIILDNHVHLIDSPGVIFETNTEYSSLVLKNTVRVEQIENPQDFVYKIVEKCPKRNLAEIYQIQDFSTAEELLYLVANRKGLLSKGGRVNSDATARSIIRDWNTGKISFYTEPPQDEITGFKIADRWEEEFDVEKLLKQNKAEIDVCEMQNAEMEDEINFIPLSNSENK